jgi:diguanylate cyclase (GGDEF)-like protein
VTLIILQLLVPDAESLRVLRAELRDAEHERKLLHRHIQRYPALLDACLELSSARELDHFANVLCQRAREMLPEVREVQVFLGSAEEQRCRASSDAGGKPCARPAGADEHYVAAEARSLIRRESGSLRMLIPLRADRRQSRDEGEALRGVLVINLVTNDVGDRLALELLGALGRLGGLGLAAVDLVNQARGLALRDDLTGLFGQHEFLRRLEEQGAACRRQGISLGLIMCDMDHLKRFNDQHGHLAGDDALRAVSAAITATLPMNSIACRYGGEEFAALVVGSDLQALTVLAEQLRQAIAASTPMAAQPELHVTASLGVAVARVNQESARAALNRADAACYQAKALGRNRVEVAS